MKVGDIVLCKKDIPYSSIKEGWLCVIEEIDENNIAIKYDHRTKYYLNLTYHSKFYYERYFYTEKELRKLKLLKIQNV